MFSIRLGSKSQTFAHFFLCMFNWDLIMLRHTFWIIFWLEIHKVSGLQTSGRMQGRWRKRSVLVRYPEMPLKWTGRRIWQYKPALKSNQSIIQSQSINHSINHQISQCTFIHFCIMLETTIYMYFDRRIGHGKYSKN